MRELLDENGKRKKKERKRKEENYDHMIGQKRREICALCRSVFWQSWRNES